ncbi:MAG: glutamate--tRNA ligase [Candidatus Berkelbacteria bacterium]|nr:glutamate--tRNA ligase [Candidatus Berkelbacteria bacterium]
MIKPIVRIAPSPTGKLHIGTARTALFNYLFARKNKGKYLIRIEDTDAKRSTKNYEKDILNSLKWLGLEGDDEPTRQMERIEIYKKYAENLLKEKKAYYCFCSIEKLEEERRKQISKKQPPRYSGKCRNLSEKEIETYQKEDREPTIRLKIPEDRGTIAFNDLIRGEIKERASLIGDFVIIKSDGVPIFFFAGVIDDHLQKISHVIRGEDHISNTFSQILIYEALKWGKKMPEFAHLPMILNADRSKMSKRKGDFVSVSEFKKEGYLPKALVNFIALLGWHPRKEGKEGKELYRSEELISLFDIEEVGKSPAIFDKQKLDYINGYYLRKLSDDELKSLIYPEHLAEGWQDKDKIIEKAIILVKDRMKKLSDFSELADYFFEKPVYDQEILIFKKSDKSLSQKGLSAAILKLKEIDKKDWQRHEVIQKALEEVVKKEKLNNGDVFWPVRAALSGREASPSPVELLWALGKNESLKRLSGALELINK